MPPHIFDIYNDAVNTDELTDSLFMIEELQSKLEEVCRMSSNSNKFNLFTITIPFESIDPLAALEFLSSDNDFQYYWEHPDEKLALAAGKEVVKIRTNQRDRYNIIQKHISDWQNRTVSFSSLTHSLSGLHFLGGFSFQNQPQEYHWKGFGTASFVIPEWLLLRDGQLSLLTITTKVQHGTLIEELKATVRDSIHDIVDSIRNLTKNEQKFPENYPKEFHNGYKISIPDDAEFVWKSTILKTKERINKGEFKKIVLAREVCIELQNEPCATQMLNYLRNEYPTCYTFMVRLHRHATFLGCTPEKLVALRSTFILTDGLAGTISRGKTATEDTILERRLLQSDKDLIEHGFVVDAIGNRLKDITHNINYPFQPGIRKYQNVQHLYTPITASVNKHVSPLEIVEKLHPTPAVGGYPREQTLHQIQSLEKIDRGWYAGPVGWINTHGRGEFCVAIRSGLLQQGHARFFAGCGIVADSDPQSEWNETNLKLIPMISALENA